MRLCRKRGHGSIYREARRPAWQRAVIYIAGTAVLILACVYLLREDTPVQFTKPDASDAEKPPGVVATESQINDVYWRVSIRHISDVLRGVCEDSDYTVLTNKNVVLDGLPMRESYVYLCTPVAGIQSVLNVRAVAPSSSSKTVKCRESYGGQRKTVTRRYPFSLKYVSGHTFAPQTKVIREPAEACIWLHAIDVVESVWF